MRKRLINLIGVVLLLAVWQGFGAHLGDALLATPIQVVRNLSGTLHDLLFMEALWSMIWQMLLGYALALVVGVPLGVAMGRSRIVRAMVKPWASMFVVVSAAALVPLFMLLMGRGLLLITGVVFAATVWYAVLTMMEAARSVSPSLLNVARSYNATRWQSFRIVLLPALHPYILISARIGLTHALRGLITVQMFIGSGYGGLINDAGLELSTASLFGLILVLMVVSIAATGLLRWIALRSAPWYESRTRA